MTSYHIFTNCVKEADVLFLTNFLLAAAPEATVTVEDTITSPVKNLQKKTDLFQLQKVFYYLCEETQPRRWTVTVLFPGVSCRPCWR